MAPFLPSGLGSTPYPPSSITAATTACSNERDLTFASEWYFKPEGVKLVKQRFELELHKRRIPRGNLSNQDLKKATHRWNEEDQTFRVCCLLEDIRLVWRMFYKVIVDVIRSESGEDSSDTHSGISWPGNYEEDPPIQSDFIERLEIWQKENGMKETSVQPQPETDPGTDNTRVSSYQDLVAGQSVGTPATTVPSETFPELIKYYKSRTSWSVDPELDLDRIASDQVLKELEGLTGCQFVKALNKHKIYVGSHHEENCSLAILKLDNLRKYFHWAPYMDHVFYSEGEENFQVVLKLFVDIKKGYFETTLLEHLRQPTKCYDQLSAAITVRIAPYNHSLCCYASVKNVHIFPVVNSEDKDCGLAGWNGFKYSAKGQPTELHQSVALAAQANDLALKHSITGALQSAPVQSVSKKQNKDASIQRWANEIPDMTNRPLGHHIPNLGNYGGVEATSRSADKNPNKPAWDTYKHFDDTPVLRKNSIARQQSVGLAERISAMRSAISVGDVPAPVSKVPQQRVLQRSAQSQKHSLAANCRPAAPSQARKSTSAMSATHAIARQSTKNPCEASQSLFHPRFAQELAENNAGTTWTSSQPSSGQPRNQTASEKIRPRSITLAPPTLVSAKDSKDFLDQFLYEQAQRSILDEDLSVVEYTDPLMQPINWEEHAKDSKSCDHVVSETLQPLNEVATRSFHNTMKQRAPKKPKSNPFAGRLPVPPPSPTKAATTIVDETQLTDPLPELVRKLDESFALMMNRARGFRGQVVVQAEFGRIMLHNIHRKHVTPRNSTDNTISTQELQSKLLSAEPGFDTLFTKVLTSSPGEMSYLFNLTKGDGKQLWDDKGSNWCVKYEFYFQDNAAFQKRQFCIEIDAETFVTQIKSWQPLGNIFTHGTGRHWDFCIAANGSESGRGLEKDYGRLATAIELSLHVPTDSSTPMLYFELEASISEQFQFERFHVRRICEYESENTKSALRISEIQSLDIQKFAIPDKSLMVFKLSPEISNKKPFEKLGRWYEASISCPLLDELLEENKKLQIGEETRWTVKDFLNADVAQSIYLPAFEMLKMMDGVGQHNHNGLDVRSGANTSTSQVSQKPTEVFW